MNAQEKLDSFYNISSRVETCLREDEAAAISALPVTSTSTSSSSGDLKVKLPKLTLPNFDGKPLEWQPFWDIFTSTVDGNESLGDIKKFSYLLSLLSGTAKECIAGLTLTAKNYNEAVKVLKERFANPQAMISAQMESLVKLPVIKSMNNITGLRKIYDHVESSVRNLNTSGITPDG